MWLFNIKEAQFKQNFKRSCLYFPIVLYAMTLSKYHDKPLKNSVYNILHFSSNVLSNLLWNSCISEPQIVCEQIFIAASCLSGPPLSEAIFWLPTKKLSCLNDCLKSSCVTLTALVLVFYLFILSFSSLDAAVCIYASFSAHSIDNFPMSG